MTIIVGLYSPRAKSGKSTACRTISAAYATDLVKISGAMKAMCAQAIAAFVPADDMDAWVEGAHKDQPVPGLMPDCAHNPAVAEALVEAMGVQRAQDHTPLPLTDARGTPLTKARIQADLVLAWGQALAGIFAQTGALTPRDLQKTLGLEFGRTLYGMDFWLRLVKARVDSSTAPVVIIDDVRFPDDIQFVAARPSVSVRIHRPSAEDIDAHPSEGLLESWPFDCSIDNDSTLEVYQERLHTTLIPLIKARIDAL